MGYSEYQSSRTLELKAMELDSNAFYALIMAAMRQADTDNARKLREAFPATYRELRDRYNAPGGILEGEEER